MQNSNSQVDVEVLADAADVNAMYNDSLLNLKDRKPVIKGSVVPHSEAERELLAKEYYASVRTNVSTRAVVLLRLLFVWFGGAMLTSVIPDCELCVGPSGLDTVQRKSSFPI